MKTKREIYQEKMQAKLDQINAKIDAYSAQFDETRTDIELTVKERLDNLLNLQKNAKQKFEEIKSSGEDVWMELQSGLEDAVDDLESSYKQAVSKVNEVTG